MNTLKDIGEFGFINRVRNGCLIRPERIVMEIGDDAAAFYGTKDLLTLVTTDLLVEGVHFLKKSTSGYDLGFKAMAVNLSDIAAMGGTAREAFVSLAIPPSFSLDYLADLYRGMRSLAHRYSVNILGGDTTSASSDLVINLTIVGEVAESQMLRRDRARPGDIIYCTGYLGDSRAGLHLITQNVAGQQPDWEELISAHLMPRPHLEEGRFLAAREGIHAAIDVSDGLSSDISHIAEQSNVGVCLWKEKLPVSDPLKAFCCHFDFDPVDFALAGGEDYVLLCTADPLHAQKLETDFEACFARPIFPIGTISEDRLMTIEDRHGQKNPLSVAGWDHFKKG